MSLTILHPGAFSMLIDAGRPCSRHLGVPRGGPADRAAWKIANALMGNPPESPAIEFALSGPCIQTDRPVSLAVFGCECSIQIDGRFELHSGAVFSLYPGQRLQLGSVTRGMRGYLAVVGGFSPTRMILNSVSSLEALKPGTTFEIESIPLAARSLPEGAVQPLLGCSSELPLRIIPGPQSEWFDCEQFTGSSFKVDRQSNRMGVRLLGSPVVRPRREMTSEAVAPGAIQSTNEGLPIILGVDGQTIGGYPKIGHIIDADLDRVGQLRPDQEVRFEWVTLEMATRIGQEYYGAIQKWLLRLRIAERLPGQFR